MSDIQYVTQEGLDKLRKELDQLEGVERLEISKQIGEARDKGDLSENAEYDAAKEAQGLLEMKISKIKNTVANARVIDPSQIDTSKVSILCSVKIINQANKAELTYKLVPETEADLATGKISINTPIAKGLLGKEQGEIANIVLPNGNKLDLEIVEIFLES